MAKRVALVVLALICLISRSLTSTISPRLFTPSPLVSTHAAASHRGPWNPAPQHLPSGMPAARLAGMPAAPQVDLAHVDGSTVGRSSTSGTWSVASLALATVALAFYGLARPVATCAADGYDDGFPGDSEWNQPSHHEMAITRAHLESIFAPTATDCSEAQYYADPDVPSDVEFSGVCQHHEHNAHIPHPGEEHPLHHALGVMETMVKDALESWKPTGFPFHHFPAAKRAADFFTEPKGENAP